MINKKDDTWVQVDAYMVPSSEVELYKRQREELAEAALSFFGTFCYSVAREWAGSQDGEAVVGCNVNGEIIALIHLDPGGIEMMQKCNTLLEFNKALLEYNEISEDVYLKWIAKGHGV